MFKCAGVLVVVCLAPLAQAQDTHFQFTSTPESWVGHGFATYAVSPADNWNFTVTGSPSSSYIDLSARNREVSPPSGIFNWELQLKAPQGQPLAPGLYQGAMRFPFQSPTAPGFWLSGNGRGDNVVTGYFNVLQAEAVNDVWTRFAVDFRQYDEGDIDNYVDGQWRFNATVPEPAAIGVLALAACVIAGRHRPRSSRIG